MINIHTPNDGRQIYKIYDDLKIPYPEKGAIAAECRIEIFQGAPKIVAQAVGNEIFVGLGTGYLDSTDWPLWFPHPRGGHVQAEISAEPFIKVRVLGQAYTKKGMVKKRVPDRWGYPSQIQEVEEVLGYPISGSEYRGDVKYEPYFFLNIEISTLDGSVVKNWECKFPKPMSGLPTLSETGNTVSVSGDFFGLPYSFTRDLRSSEYPHDAFKSLKSTLKEAVRYGQDKSQYWEAFLQYHSPINPDSAKVSATENQKNIAPNLSRLAAEEPVVFSFYNWLKNGKTVRKGCNNTYLAAFLKQSGSDYDDLLRELKSVMLQAEEVDLNTNYSGNSVKNYDTRPLVLLFSGAKEKKELQEQSADWSKRKSLSAQAEGLGISAEKFPLLFEAVKNGNVPTTVFRQPTKAPVNREFKIWEKALGREGWAQSIYEIAASAASRSTYEKDITPYLNFLFRLEKYLERHTGAKWSSQPKFVNTQWELEMDEPTETGTSKKRSAFTPVADNETRVVTVPYVAVRVSGVRTQWCYSRFYHVFEEGMIDPISGGVVDSDLEEKLNGRDDYGVMYFTLTGTDIARGYPTFLIIFERIPTRNVDGVSSPDCPKCNGKRIRKESKKQLELFSNCPKCHPKTTGGTRVHFHRTHPSRRRGDAPGDEGLTPACNLIQECYRYMAGNVTAEEITAQQGDLIFIRCKNGDPREKGSKVKDVQMVNEFESHRFVHLDPEFASSAMPLYPSNGGPKNRLGFLHAERAFSVQHPEHENIHHLEQGWWEVRRCKSWEANPHAVWTLTID